MQPTIGGPESLGKDSHHVSRGLLLGAAPDSLASWHSRCAIHQDFPNFLESRLPRLELLGYLLQKAHRPSVIISFSTGPAHRDLDGEKCKLRALRKQTRTERMIILRNSQNTKMRVEYSGIFCSRHLLGDRPSPSLLSLLWHTCGNALATMPPIVEKITVTGQHKTVWVLFGHTYEASIGQGHGHIGISRQQRFDRHVLILQAKGHLDYPALQEG